MTSGLQRFRSFFRDRNGAAAIEFAIVGNAFVMLLIGIAYVGVIYWHAANLDWAVQAGSRIAVLNSSATQSDIASAVNGYLAQVGMGAADVTYSVATSNGVKVASIAASKSEIFNVPLINNFHITFQSSAEVPQP